MPEIQQNNRVVTQITTVKLPPDKQDEVLELMAERARFMATQPGLVSVSLHRSQDAATSSTTFSGRPPTSWRRRIIRRNFARSGPRSARSRKKSSLVSTRSSTSRRA